MVSIEKNRCFLHLAPFGAKQWLQRELWIKQAQLRAFIRKKA
jgi:hypothetical protein